MAILPGALLRHAAERPEVPWLFWAEGWDWRWLSWGEAARRVMAEADTFAGGPPLVPSPDPLTPAALITDLASQAAGAVVRVRGSGDEWQEWGAEDLGAAADAVAREVAPAGPPAGGREILVAGRPLAEPAERAVVAWAILQGAALLL
ncbi:MAG TPA: hypothetical protein VEL74_21770, partial [Thermoanaerobaculia bacterium]|nr:hypothetical protein [Thermoanaerobaculia bacterium]